jgi:hypothetical protein
MRIYIIYVEGEEVKPYIKAGSQSSAEKKAQKKYPGKNVQAVYTEVQKLKL